MDIQQSTLPSLVSKAGQRLLDARNAAEVLEARDFASVAYDAAKKAARLSKAKGAHDTLIAVAHRAQADALDIESQAKRRLADEYDAAQESGNVAKQGRPKNIPGGNVLPTASDIGLTNKEIHEAKIIRNAERDDPGIVRRALDAALDAGEEPTRAKVTRVVKSKSKRTRSPRPNFNNSEETQHDRDLRMLLGVWEAACESAREEFLIDGLGDDADTTPDKSEPAEENAEAAVDLEEFNESINPKEEAQGLLLAMLMKIDVAARFIPEIEILMGHFIRNASTRKRNKELPEVLARTRKLAAKWNLLAARLPVKVDGMIAAKGEMDKAA